MEVVVALIEQTLYKVPIPSPVAMRHTHFSRGRENCRFSFIGSGVKLHWGHDVKIPQHREKRYVACRLEVIESTREKNLWNHVLPAGAKRGARLPRPPLDPPSVGSAAFGFVSQSITQSTIKPTHRPSRKKGEEDPFANLESHVG